jgi:CBS domain-containing protein
MHLGAECIGEDDSVAAAAQRMRDLGVGSLPICGADDRLHDILTDRDNGRRWCHVDWLTP